MDCVAVELIEVVRCVIKMVTPLETEPVNIFFDRANIFSSFFGGVGIIKAEMADRALVLSGDPEVETDRLGVADMEIPVRLRRKPGHDPALVLLCLYVLGDDRPYEIGWGNFNVPGIFRVCIHYFDIVIDP